VIWLGRVLAVAQVVVHEWADGIVGAGDGVALLRVGEHAVRLADLLNRVAAAW